MQESLPAEGREGARPALRFRIEWVQDRESRLVRITGLIDEDKLGHLHHAMLDLGERRLTIDLTDAQVATGLQLPLDELETRLGPRLGGVLPPRREGFDTPSEG